ncbi:MAG: Tudor-knot domain-containing protein [Polyangiaceae bacterium]
MKWGRATEQGSYTKVRIKLLAAVVLSLWLTACQEPYRVGEFVWVEWEGKNYPAYIIDQKSKTRFRVHFDGYDERWDEDVTLDRIKGRIEDGKSVSAPPPPEKVARVLGLKPRPSASSASVVSPYQKGDKIRVKWRESIYPATVVEVLGPDKCKVHYDGHEEAWDEVVDTTRIEGRR